MLSVKNFINYTNEGGGGGEDFVKIVYMDVINEVEPLVLSGPSVIADPFVKASNNYSQLTLNTTYD